MASSKRSDSSDEGRRGQSETVGFVLLFGMVLVTAGIIVSFGAAAVTESEESLSADRAEKVMTQMDSEISMVALGRTNSQEIDFDRVPEEKFTIDEESGQIDITKISKKDGSTEKIMDNVTLGAIKFERGNTVVAYQGGGVWRSDGEGSGMISPPEFNYRDQTLTLPLVTINGDQSLNNGATIEKDGASTEFFPSDKFSNPLENDVVQVTVESEFHHGWRNYFETRTEGEVRHDPANHRVSVNLTAPAVESFDYGVATTSGKYTLNGNGAEFENQAPGAVSAPSVSPNVESEISDGCGNDCTDVGSTMGGTTLSDSRYYSDESDVTVETNTVFDTGGDDVEVVIDGDLHFEGSGGPGDLDQEITGGGQVRFYVKGDVEINGNAAVNTGGDSEDLVVLVHSDADTVQDSGTVQFTGFIYAPNSDFSIRGGGKCGNNGNGNGNGNGNNANPKGCTNNVFGGVISETATATGGGYVAYDDDADLTLELGADTNVLTFLHISTNPVTVTEQ